MGAQRVTDLLAAWAGGQVVGGHDTYPVPDEPVTISLDPAYMRRMIGMPISDDTQIDILSAIACTVTPTGDRLEVVPPVWRPDLLIPADLVEEVARFYGYDQIEPCVPTTGQPGTRRPDHQAERMVRERLAGSGWTEVLCYPFTSMKALGRLGLDEDDPRLDPIHLVNPLSGDEEVLRTTLMCGLAEVLAKNVNRGTANVAVFEIGHVFLRPTPALPAVDGGPTGVTLPAEPQMLAMAACGQFQPSRPGEPGRLADVYDLTGAVEQLTHALGFDQQAIHLEPIQAMPFHPGRAARLLDAKGQDLGVLGEWHPRIIKAFGLPARSVFAELNLDRLIGASAGHRSARIPSPLPGLRFDVAVVATQDVPYRRVRDVVQAAAGERLTHIGLFDVYQGAPLADGHRSLAFNLVLDDPHTQLTDAQEAEAIANISAAVRAQGWEVRGR